MNNEIYDDLDELPAPPRKDIPEADRELLELAARALGAIRVETVEGENWVNLHFADGTVVYGWNSLAFSGDAFELGVKLKLFDEHPGFSYMLAEELGPTEEGRDPIIATRRAATRAAAEINKQHS